MCITLFSAAQRPNKETLQICFTNNSDGAGFAYAHEGKLHLQKGFFTFDDFWAHYKDIPQNVPCILHFRKVSVGPKDKKNCHPWRIDENHCFAHNGTIKQFDFKNAKVSDTGKFVDEMLKPMFSSNQDNWATKWAKELLENYIGAENKCIILSNTGKYLLLNENRGMWEGEVWFSNDSFRRRGVTAWGDYAQEPQPSQKKTFSLTNVTLEFAPASLATVDDLLEKLNKQHNKNRWSKAVNNGQNVKIKKAYNIKLTPYAEKLIDAADKKELTTHQKKTKNIFTTPGFPHSGFRVNEMPFQNVNARGVLQEYRDRKW